METFILQETTQNNAIRCELIIIYWKMKTQAKLYAPGNWFAWSTISSAVNWIASKLKCKHFHILCSVCVVVCLCLCVAVHIPYIERTRWCACTLHTYTLIKTFDAILHSILSLLTYSINDSLKNTKYVIGFPNSSRSKQEWDGRGGNRTEIMHETLFMMISLFWLNHDIRCAFYELYSF